MTDTLKVHIVQPSLLHHRLRAWHRAVELVQLVHAAPIGDAELREQASRAARSCALNIAEGAALRGAAKRRHFVIAQGSVVETVAAYELAAAIGERVPVARVQELGAMLWPVDRSRHGWIGAHGKNGAREMGESEWSGWGEGPRGSRGCRHCIPQA